MVSGDLTFPRILLLRIVASRGKSSSKELAAVMGVTTANIPGLLDRLESNGYVTRTRDSRDRRIVYVEATSAGRKKLKELWRAGMRELAGEFEDWTEGDLRTLLDLLTRVAASRADLRCGPKLVTIQSARGPSRRGR